MCTWKDFEEESPKVKQRVLVCYRDVINASERIVILTYMGSGKAWIGEDRAIPKHCWAAIELPIEDA